MKACIIFFIDRIFCHFFALCPIRRIYISSAVFKTYFIAHMIWQMNAIKYKNNYLSCFLTPTWYLKKSDRKSSSITSSALLLIMISMLSFFECITGLSSFPLEEINLKLIVVVNLIFHVWDYWHHFWYLLGLIFVRYFFIFNVIIIPNITYSFFNLKRFLIFLIVVPSISYFSTKGFLRRFQVIPWFYELWKSCLILKIFWYIKNV